MCGIFGYVGKKKDAVKLALSGLKKMEYRGYDSAGVAGVSQGKIALEKRMGKVAELETAIAQSDLNLELGIAHTRWATHGPPSQDNAHPHLDAEQTLAVVHNGIIENHDVLRKSLQADGCEFVSQTDTEVIAQLIHKHYNGDILRATQQVLTQLKGAFALCVIHRDHPDQIIAAAQESPLAIGIGNDEAFIASDTQAFLLHTREVIYLHDGEVAAVRRNSLEVYDRSMSEVLKEAETLVSQVEDVSKGSYEHYTIKEIFEQPQSLRNALLARYLDESGTACLEGLGLTAAELKKVGRVLILACGTSWHAGYVASYMLEDRARIPVQVEVASEFRYKNPVIEENTLVLAISQSGETADTLAATRELKRKGAKVIAICNVQRSTLVREADGCILLRAGPEIGVCSTKAFTSQLVALQLFGLLMARMRHMGQDEGKEIVEAMKALPDLVQKVLHQSAYIQVLARKYARFDHFFFLGRRYMFPTALEGALKLKEISYINASGYPAGEMKHGPIALISENCPSVAMCCDGVTYKKMLSSLMEVKARGGPILAIAFDGAEEIKEIADDVIFIPPTLNELASVLVSVVGQLFAYYVAKERGAEIDQPRNLAKSVTVE